MSLSVPIFGTGEGFVGTWLIVNADTPLEVPLIGQFNPLIKRSGGKPIWTKKPGIAGGKSFIKYVGKGVEMLWFTFHAISINQIDPYPSAALSKLFELSDIDTDLGRPPRVYFVHGFDIVEGFITDVPDKIPKTKWYRSPLVREIGPVEIGITIIPSESIEIPIGTNFRVRTEETTFEEYAKVQYQDARFGQSLDEFNQGVRIEETVELPRRSNPAIAKTVSIAPFLGETIEGL